MIDEMPMVSSDLQTKINAKLSEVFSTNNLLPFTGLSVVVIGDYFQLPPVKGTLVFSRTTSGSKMNLLLILQLWHLFIYAKLTEFVRHCEQAFLNVLESAFESKIYRSI